MQSPALDLREELVCGNRAPRPVGSKKNAQWHSAEVAKLEERVGVNVVSGSAWDQCVWEVHVERIAGATGGPDFGFEVPAPGVVVDAYDGLQALVAAIRIVV
jgi:hypothetical protein